jgi:hypothetical protein
VCGVREVWCGGSDWPSDWTISAVLPPLPVLRAVVFLFWCALPDLAVVLPCRASSVDNLFSNDVLEAEVTRLQKLPQDEGVTLRLQQVEAKMQILIVQVQTGRLTMEGYTEQVQKKIQEERDAAKQLVAAGCKQSAMNALRRAKIMQAELEE